VTVPFAQLRDQVKLAERAILGLIAEDGIVALSRET